MDPDFVPRLVAGFLFGLVGMIGFGYGKVKDTLKPKLIGGALMFFPYFVSNLILIYIIGAAFTISLFIFKD
ncbi:MAG: hypothetical protein ACKO2G_10700 [Verrucomicrobiales bacterium]